MVPPCFLKLGDVVRIEVEGVGAIENKVIAGPAVSS
jgi:2-keto-4-pentenoate hydratase/2-oxohepta-3-ene-1,7-dioic acid hydratase in catechol pathway